MENQKHPQTNKENQLLQTAVDVKEGKRDIQELFNMVDSEETALLAAKHKKILQLADVHGKAVAHVAARHPSAALKIIRSHPELLKLSDKDGWTVAHIAACHPSAALEITKSHPEYLKLSDKEGITVAHIAARHPSVALEILRSHPELFKGKHGESLMYRIRDIHPEIVNTEEFQKAVLICNEYLGYVLLERLRK